MKQKNNEPQQADPPAKEATALAEIWFAVDNEHRRLYAIRKNEAGKLLFYMDRNDVLELQCLKPCNDESGWSGVTPELSPADVMTIAKSNGLRGIYYIQTHSGRNHAAYMLRRKYTDAERSLIPPNSEEAAKPDATPAAPGKTEAPLADYVFRRNGDFWQIVFDGRELPPMRHLAGMTYLYAMLARPGHDFPAPDLYAVENPPPGEKLKEKPYDPEERKRYGKGGSRQKVIDHTQRAMLEKSLHDYEKERDHPDTTPETREEMENHIAMIKKALASVCVASSTGGATFEPKEKKGPRQGVSAALERAYDAIANKPHGGSLAKHLRDAVRKGNKLSYAGGLDWKT